MLNPNQIFNNMPAVRGNQSLGGLVPMVLFPLGAAGYFTFYSYEKRTEKHPNSTASV